MKKLFALLIFILLMMNFSITAEEKNNSSISNIVFLIIIEIFVFGFFIMSWLKVVRTSAYYREEALMKTALDRITNNGTLYFLRYTDGFTNVIYDYSKIYLVFLLFSLMIYFNYSTFFWILTTIMSVITIVQWLHHKERCEKIISFVHEATSSFESIEERQMSIDMGGRVFAPVIDIYKRKRDMSIICLVLLYVTGLIAK